ncbi:hypothetical protein SDC9_109105 [bioreactor metagenome]|uniref:Uncharacterized protein n=1 Tax=bioreactor metagenome TaxID=1076179 RepID=A0A645B9U5_9ZZZZ
MMWSASFATTFSLPRAQAFGAGTLVQLPGRHAVLWNQASPASEMASERERRKENTTAQIQIATTI